MDKTTIIGIVLGIIAILAGMIAKGTSLAVLFNLPAIFIIFLGTAAAVLIGFPSSEIKTVPKLFKVLFTEKKPPNIEELIQLFVKLGTIARKEGLLALESEISKIEDPFLEKGMKMVVDGLDPDFIRDTLLEEISAYVEPI